MIKKTKTHKTASTPRQDQMVGPIKYKKPTGDTEPSKLEIASLGKEPKITKKQK